MTKFTFLNALDNDIQLSLLNQLRDIWTHTSTALEGNTLTLGETKFVIEEGLTVSGKPLKDHQEIVGHARAIELIYKLIENPITQSDLFELHKAVQTSVVSDIYKPVGAWKAEPNGTYAIGEDGKQEFIDYSAPAHVPKLMQEWLAELNRLCSSSLDLTTAINAYSQLHMGFVHIHPFWDGNGRMARLLSNLPLLKSGHAPLVIQQSRRQEYIQLLSQFQLQTGVLDSATGVWPDLAELTQFQNFCESSYQTTTELIENAKAQQAKRKS
ncbi:Fic family protein [Aliikangiella coralliicola]|uniref:Fic family protein n=1 Tax=Aliikangiella coralliicola TaxID=2592383 RepID=A0A545UC05_9GAMM|nr:Fic family protein [Aliikangiella coralliicola]TQV86999.1 Fic family protein [Aliikangiella coralliicola]